MGICRTKEGNKKLNYTTQPNDVQNNQLISIVKLRIAIGLLGDENHGKWWPSLWFTANAKAFLSPIYGERTDDTRYRGLVETARLVHDTRIGIGRAFHLFRLPETLERRIHEGVIKERIVGFAGGVPSKADAEAFLDEMARPLNTKIGPIRVGSTIDLERSAWTKVLAGHYSAAFKNSQQTFPYFSEAL